MRRPPTKQPAVIHRHSWLWEPLEEEASFVLRPMFGARAVYLHGKIIAGFFTKEEPWRGMLISTERQYHESLVADFPVLAPHPVLSKWLYLPEADEDFDRIAEEIMRLARNRDPRVGVIPPEKKKKSRPQK